MTTKKRASAKTITQLDPTQLKIRVLQRLPGGRYGTKGSVDPSIQHRTTEQNRRDRPDPLRDHPIMLRNSPVPCGEPKSCEQTGGEPGMILFPSVKEICAT